MNDVVICVGAGALQVPLLREAKAYGLHVVATDGNPEAPGASVADTFAQIDTYDLQGHFNLAMQLPYHGKQIRGVVTAGADVAPTVAVTAAVAEVPGIPLAVAARSHNKALTRKALHDAQLSCYQPEWIHWILGKKMSKDIDASVEKQISYPCVVKPLQQRASRGVTIVHTRGELPQALRKAKSYEHELLIESYHTGTEHSVEAIFHDEQLLWFNIVDRYFTYEGGVPLETGHVNPSKLSLLSQQRLEVMLRVVAKALGVTWGPFKIDVLWTADGPILLEATCRLSGGWDCQRTSPLTGRHPLQTLLQVACQLQLAPVLAPDGYGACAAILPQGTGTVHQVPVPSPGVVHGYPGAVLDDVFWSVVPGDRIQRPAHCAERAGFVTTWAPTYAAAWEAAQGAATALAFTMDIQP